MIYILLCAVVGEHNSL